MSNVYICPDESYKYAQETVTTEKRQRAYNVAILGEIEPIALTIDRVHNKIVKVCLIGLTTVLLYPLPVANAESLIKIAAVIRTSNGSLDVLEDSVSQSLVSSTLNRWSATYNVISSGVNSTRTLRSEDPEVSKQWGYARLGGPALNTYNQGSGVVIAVIDTGVDATHPDLEGKVLDGWDSMNKDGKGTRDPNGHGTHIAGIIAATPNNGIGVAGLAPGVKILPVRVLDSSGNGDDGELAIGIIWAVDNGADVLNISIGGAVPSDLLEGSLDYALSKDVVVVVAAGNGALNGNVPSYPGAYPQVLTVGAVDSSNKRAAYSSTGDYLDIVAPGSWIRSTWPQNSYQWSSGTSMATPFVAASAAILIASTGGRGSQISSKLEMSAIDLGAVGKDPVYGFGLVNPLKALGLQESADPVPTTPYMPTLDSPALTMPSLPKLPMLITPKLPDLPVLVTPSLPSLPILKLPLIPEQPVLVVPSLPRIDKPTLPQKDSSIDRDPITVSSKYYTIVPASSARRQGNKVAITVHLQGVRPLTAYVTIYVTYAGSTYKLKTNAKSVAKLEVRYSESIYTVLIKKSVFNLETVLIKTI